MDFDVRHVVCSSAGTRVLFGAFEHDVSLVELDGMEPPKAIRTIFDFGGSRLALSDEVNGILAAAYSLHGVAFYSGFNGDEIWCRKDIKKVQRVSLSSDGEFAFCGRDTGPLIILDLATGKTVDTMRGVRALQESSFDQVKFADGTNPCLIGEKRIPIQLESFAILSSAFGPNVFAFSEAGGSLCCIDTKRGKEMWRYSPPAGNHVLDVGYRKDSAVFLGIEWPFQNGGNKLLLHISAETGEILQRQDIGKPVDTCFAKAGKMLVTSSGQRITT